MSFSEKQKEILRFPYSGYSALICDGAVRSGKTVIMSLSFVLWAMSSFNHQNFGICGKTVIAAERNVIRPLMSIKYLREHFCLQFHNHMLTVTRGKRSNTFYIFGGKDESSYTLIQGVTLAGVLLDEVALMPQSFVDQAIARTLSVPDAKLFFNCNPEGPRHWFYLDWIQHPEKHNAKHLHFTLDDNPALTEQAKNDARSKFAGVFYDRYIRGLWVVAEGRVYPMFDEKAHVVDEPPQGGRYYISIDYGILNPFSAGLWCYEGGVATRIAEYYYDGRKEKHQRTDEEHYAEVEKLAAGRYIQRVVVDPSASSFIQTIYRHGKFAVDKATNDVIPGIAYTATQLNTGHIKIHRSCKDLIREMGMYRWDEKKGEDAVIKENDHACDDMRYFAYTILRGLLR